jgi:predicted RecA/RadA family phage recombinase
MATAQFIHDGNTLDYTPSANVSAGDVVVQGDLVGIAKLDISAGALGALAVTGVFDVPKASGAGTAIAAGAKVYWNATNNQATTTATGSKYLGKSVRAAADADATVRVRLEQ